jgi:hypothetical protein
MPRPALVINAAEYLIAVVTHLPTAGGAAAGGSECASLRLPRGH